MCAMGITLGNRIEVTIILLIDYRYRKRMQSCEEVVPCFLVVAVSYLDSI